MAGGVVHAPRPRVRDGDIVMGLGKIRADPKGLFIVRDRIRQTVGDLRQLIRQIVLEIRVIGIDSQAASK